MPGFNGTGPLGNGPMTGRGAGICKADTTADSANVNTMNNVNPVGTFCRCGQFLRRGPYGGRGGSAGRNGGLRGGYGRGNWR